MSEEGEMETLSPVSPQRHLNYNIIAAKGVVPTTWCDPALDKTKGVLIRRLAGVTLPELLDAIGKVILPSKIKYADFCGAANFEVWFDSVESVDTIVAFDTITIKGQLAKINRYLNPVRRVVLRNVPPFIPDDVLLQLLEKYGEVRSGVEHQACFGVGEEFSHVKSFTRTISLSIQNGVMIPPSEKVRWDGINHNIYLQVGAKKCFSCGKSGHTNKNCPNKIMHPKKTQGNPRKTPIRKRKSISESTFDDSEIDSQKRSRFDVSQAENELSSEGEGTDSTVVSNGRKKKKIFRKRGRQAEVSVPTSSNSSPPWAFDSWKNGSFGNYKDISTDGLLVFWSHLRKIMIRVVITA